MRKRERENPCAVCGHYHKYEAGEVCGVCGHRMPAAADRAAVQPASAFPTEIIPSFLFLGSYDNASRGELLKTLGISHILNTVPCCQNLYKNSFTYHCFQNDKSLQFDYAIQVLETTCLPKNDTRIYWRRRPVQNPLTELNLVAQKSVGKQCEKDKARILVHCMSGKNRSPAIVMAYLMKSKGWQLTQSHQWVKDRRPQVELSSDVYQQLLEYEQRLFGSTEPVPVQPSLPSDSLTGFGFGYPKTSDTPQILLFNQPSSVPSIFQQSRPSIVPCNFVFGADRSPEQKCTDNNVFGGMPPGGSEAPMDSS